MRRSRSDDKESGDCDRDSPTLFILNCFRRTQVRGSIPLVWKSPVSMKYAPKVLTGEAGLPPKHTAHITASSSKGGSKGGGGRASVSFGSSSSSGGGGGGRVNL